jgi:DNA-nicking Smr family endonuclease
VEIDARIDLHGSTVELARIRLLDFLIRARFSGARLVLVITGKGPSPFSSHTLHGRDPYHAPERGGVLRKSSSMWLAEPEFRYHVIGFQPAHPRHGGGGAFYVKLRRKGAHEP